MIKSFLLSLRLLRRDKGILLFSSFPIAIGIGLYILLGSWIFSSLLPGIQKWIQESLVSGGWGSVLYYIIVSLMTVVVYFIINWTFVLVVSLIAGPFNDMISSRVEKALGSKEPESLSTTFKEGIKRFAKTIVNELKKIFVIVFLTGIAVGLSFIPIMAPVSIGITALLLAVSFVDYNWCRHEFPLKRCMGDVRKSFFSYTLAGFVFMGLMAIPFINLLALPLGVIYFSVLFVRKNGGSV